MEIVKTCLGCKKEKTLDEFTKQVRGKHGRRSRCKICQRKEKREYYKKNREAILKRERINSKKPERLEKYKRYVDDNKTKIADYKKQYDIENIDKIRSQQREWARKNRAKKGAWSAKYRFSKNQATPKWYEKEKILKLYEKVKWLEELTGLKYHVDHIIPLKSDNVCGLHVWNNLQILEASLNCSKGNN